MSINRVININRINEKDLPEEEFKNLQFDNEEQKFSKKLPYGWRKSSSGEFIQMLTGSLQLKYIYYQEFQFDQNGKKLPKSVFAKLFIFDNGDGVALTRETNHNYDVYADFYTFGCSHNFVHLDPERAKEEGVKPYGDYIFALKCTICGYIQTYNEKENE